MTRPRKKPAPPVFDPGARDALIGERRTIGEVEDLFRQMKKTLMERMLSGELTHHLGYAPGEAKPIDQPNHRNGTTPKTVLTDDGAIPLAIPRDRDGTFAPQLIPKNARRLPRFDQNVLSLYARGMTVREIQEHLEDLYQVEVAPLFISAVTDEVLDEVTAWQQRPLESCYPVVFFDCLPVKIRDEGTVRSNAVYVALGVTRSGAKEVLGLWIEQTEGAKFWYRVMTELQSRGVHDNPDRAHRWADGLSRGDQRGVSPDADPHLPRASGAPELGVRGLAGSQARGGGAADDLSRRNDGGG